MPETAGRRRAVPAALLTAALLITVTPAVSQSATAPAGLERFLYALGEVESGGNYYARNSTTGAYGKYQILPSNWAAWARAYLGSSTAPQTPKNQEIVAHRKVTALYYWLDSWSVVAHWWLTGSSERNAAYWSSFSRTYVNRIITLMKSTGSVGTTSTSSTSWITAGDLRIGETSPAMIYAGRWSTARYSGYAGGQVKYSVTAGSTAGLRFTGAGIAWVGPVGPTRGVARIYIDGVYVKTVDLRRSSFKARTLIYARAFRTKSLHTIVIKVVSSGRPVAIDQLIVGT